VVLIDEIDKAPRDLPNDVLNEVEQMKFRVAETREEFEANNQYRPILILTSNLEKGLPEAFLRRCVFFHITFPDSKRLKEIIRHRLPASHPLSEQTLDHAIAHFEEIRKIDLTRPPATAECLAWMRVLSLIRLDPANLQPGQAEQLALSYCVLVKNRDDLDKLRKTLPARTAAKSPP
jgi:MoxR-like ATPase